MAGKKKSAAVDPGPSNPFSALESSDPASSNGSDVSTARGPNSDTSTVIGVHNDEEANGAGKANSHDDANKK
jgi:hypothetical protein